MSGPQRKARRWNGFGKNIFSEITELATQEGAVNLAQGFPDCPGAPRVIEAMARALHEGSGQYAPYTGELRLRRAISQWEERVTGLSRSPADEITVTTGATEAIYAVINAFVNPGDRVLVFEPAFDTYSQAVANAGGVWVPVPLLSPDTPEGVLVGGWAVDWEAFDAEAARGFSLLILNTPHNPTGKVFSEEELARIGAAVQRQGALVLSDEVYDQLVFGGHSHVSLCQFPGLSENVVRVGSVAKMFGFTGFKLGWTAATPNLTSAIRLVHQALVFCTPSHIQLGFAEILEDLHWVETWLADYRKVLFARMDLLKDGLTAAEFRPCPPQGAFYLPASYSALSSEPDARAFVKQLLRERKVAAIPIGSFFASTPAAMPWLRFAFCKSDETISAAIKNIC